LTHPGTVKNYFSVIFDKVGIHDRAKVVEVLQVYLSEAG
jgi:DNA-binding NarL/FixJ family response regulator